MQAAAPTFWLEHHPGKGCGPHFNAALQRPAFALAAPLALARRCAIALRGGALRGASARAHSRGAGAQARHALACKILQPTCAAGLAAAGEARPRFFASSTSRPWLWRLLACSLSWAAIVKRASSVRLSLRAVTFLWFKALAGPAVLSGRL